MAETKEKCIFCRIANGGDDTTRILDDRDNLVIFKDIRPATDHHYLVVPKSHMEDAKHLSSKDIPLVEKLVSHGQEFLEEQGADVSDVRMGFHWPPFHTVSHLHLHVISPQREMGWIAKRHFQTRLVVVQNPRLGHEATQGTWLIQLS
ncbi:hypothetical protein BaRGS_00032097 [Batillaria attramentaria]|uniref:Adenosine 5'-monophosphoramidase HINT3 n=1 Tax=Batillaria attramentaria TaxID=370345 RepID=A0ABD0JPA6_9CAEN